MNFTTRLSLNHPKSNIIISSLNLNIAKINKINKYYVFKYSVVGLLKKGEFKIGNIPKEFLELLYHLIDLDPNTRYSAKDCLKDPIFQNLS